MGTKEYHKLKSKEHYENNKGKYLTSSRNARIKKREWYNSIMDEHSCIRCGIDDNRVLEWHHKDAKSKDFAVGNALNKLGRQKILEEIKKCVCLCSNCHRIEHYEMGDYGKY